MLLFYVVHISFLTAGYFVTSTFVANFAAPIKTIELNKSIKASAIVAKIDSEPEVIAATN